MSNEDRQRPSRIAEALLRSLFPERERQDLLGDYEEYFGDICHQKGRLIACLWYWMQIIILIFVSVWNSLKWNLVMIRNYFRSALRHIVKHKVHTLIKMMGLAVGVACCVMIFL